MDATNNLIITFNQPQVVPEIHDSSFNLLPVPQVEALLNTLFDFFFNLLGSMIPPIPIPGLAGWNLDIQELGPMGQADDYLGIYLSITPPKTIADSENPDTQFIFSTGNRIIKRSDFIFDGYQSALYGLSDGKQIEVLLEATGRDSIDKYYYSLDGSAWRLLSGNRLTLRSLIEGNHELVVKAVNEYNLEDTSPAVLQFTCDNIPPEIISFKQNGNRMEVTAWDYTDDSLRYRFRIDAGAWSEATTSPYLELAGLPAGKHRIEAIVLDNAENASPAVSAKVTLLVPSLSNQPGSINLDASDPGSSGSDFNAQNNSSDDGGQGSLLGGCSIGSDSGTTTSLLCLMAALIAFNLFADRLQKVRIKTK